MAKKRKLLPVHTKQTREDSPESAPTPGAPIAALSKPLGDGVFMVKMKLKEFFPPDHPDSPWLLRLAVLRDDIAHEFERLGLKRDDPPGEVWRCAYTLRKLAITIGEVKSIFCHEVRGALSSRGSSFPPTFVGEFEKAVAAVERADEVMRPLRDGLGAHVRPSNAVRTKPKYDPTTDLLRAHGESEFEIRLDMKTGRTTSLRNLTVASFLFAWPDVLTDADYFRKQAEVAEGLFGCFNLIVHGIDLLLYLHWTRRSGS